MTPQNEHNSSSDKPFRSSGGGPGALDAALGSLTPNEREAQLDRERSDPSAAAERAGWDRLLALEQRAFDPHLDAAAGERIAARVVDRVRWEESRVPVVAPRAQRWRVIWVRLLAVSVAVHVAVLGVWSVVARRGDTAAPVEVFSPVVSLPRGDASSRADETGATATPDEVASLAPPAPYVVEPGDGIPADSLPVERLFRIELAAEARIPAPASAAYLAFPRGAARAMWVRGSDPMKRLIEARVGSEGSLDAVRRGLTALARFQRPDGSYEAAAGRSAPESTALVLLAFLGDGSSSRGGEHRATVERGIAWLRAWRRTASAADVGPYEVAALAEDFMLGNGTLTPAESRARSTEVAALLERAPRPVDATSEPATLAAWAMASLALERSGLGAHRSLPATASSARAVPVAARDDVPGDARTAVWTGTETLRRGDAASFRRWASTSSLALRARLGSDGLTSGLGGGPVPSEADRVEETALVLLALQVPYRTY